MRIHFKAVRGAVLPWVLIPLGLLALGCGAVKMYAGPDLPDDQVAILEIGKVQAIILDQVAVNRLNKKRFIILPGEHDVKASHGVGGYPDQIILYTFTAEPGRRYLFSADFQFKRTLEWKPWIKDLSNGQIVGNWKPQ